MINHSTEEIQQEPPCPVMNRPCFQMDRKTMEDASPTVTLLSDGMSDPTSKRARNGSIDFKDALSKPHCATGPVSQCSHSRVVSNRVLQHPPAKAICPDMGDYSMASEHQSRTVVAIILRNSVSRISRVFCTAWIVRHVHRSESNRLRDTAEKPWNPSARRTVDLERTRRDLPESPRQHNQNCKTKVQTRAEDKQKPCGKKIAPSSNRPQRRGHLQKSLRELPRRRVQ